MPMENGRSLYATLRAIDPEFGVVEFNTADLRHPERHPTYAAAYRALRDLWNAGARFVSPMAWNGSNGMHAQSADYVSFTAWRNTPLEQAACDFLLARSGLPRGSRLWTFGTAAHADDDGWRVEAGSLRALRGALELTAGAGNRIVLVSPSEVALASDAIDGIVIGLAEEVEVTTIDVDARTAIDAPWRRLAHANAGALQTSPAGRIVKAVPLALAEEVDQLRVTISLVGRARTTLTRVAILVNG
jgi:hypothetical protein